MMTSRIHRPMQRNLSRRHFLRGAGVALSLPFLSSMGASTPAKAQALAPRRYVSMYFPNGAAHFFRPAGTGGSGSEWQLSPILEPLAPVKDYLTVLSNVGNGATFGTDSIEPSHAQLCASAWTCVQMSGDGDADNGISVDQVIAQAHAGQTSLDSLQLGLATLESYGDGKPNQHSRSISWAAPNQPLYYVEFGVM